MMAIRNLVPSDDGTRTIGVLRNEKFVKYNFHSRKHLCHKYDAIGIDKLAFEDYILPNATSIECLDRDSGTRYWIETGTFQTVAILDDLGWGSQLFCPLKHWQTENASQQLSLWEAPHG